LLHLFECVGTAHRFHRLIIRMIFAVAVFRRVGGRGVGMMGRLTRYGFGGEGGFGSCGRLLHFGGGFKRPVSRRSGVVDGGTFGCPVLMRLGRKFGLRRRRLSNVIRRLRKLVLCRFPKSVVGRRSFCRFGRGLLGGERLALYDVAIPMSLAAPGAGTGGAARTPTLGLGGGIA